MGAVKGPLVVPRVSLEHVTALSYGYITAEFFRNVNAAGDVGKFV